MARRHAAWTPRFGTVRAIVLYGLLALVVRRGNAAFRETLTTVVGVDAAMAGGILFWTLVAVGLAVLTVETYRQTRTRQAFTLKAARQKYLESFVPARVRFGVYLLLLAAGGYVALFARSVFFERLDNALLVVRRVARSGDPGAFSVEALAFGAAFVLGSLAVAHAADRVLVAGIRKLLASRK
ncbi:hypothetical protein [Halosegnis sp.]|uniref:hypothetical protein n=1 Tax=Halosegnis sp. TaxID=2864959 RepID=UPI0035D4122F